MTEVSDGSGSAPRCLRCRHRLRPRPCPPPRPPPLRPPRPPPTLQPAFPPAPPAPTPRARPTTPDTAWPCAPAMGALRRHARRLIVVFVLAHAPGLSCPLRRTRSDRRCRCGRSRTCLAADAADVSLAPAPAARVVAARAAAARAVAPARKASDRAGDAHQLIVVSLAPAPAARVAATRALWPHTLLPCWAVARPASKHKHQCLAATRPGSGALDCSWCSCTSGRPAGWLPGRSTGLPVDRSADCAATPCPPSATASAAPLRRRSADRRPGPAARRRRPSSQSHGASSCRCRCRCARSSDPAAVPIQRPFRRSAPAARRRPSSRPRGASSCRCRYARSGDPTAVRSGDSGSLCSAARRSICSRSSRARSGRCRRRLAAAAAEVAPGRPPGLETYAGLETPVPSTSALRPPRPRGPATTRLSARSGSAGTAFVPPAAIAQPAGRLHGRLDGHPPRRCRPRGWH